MNTQKPPDEISVQLQKTMQFLRARSSLKPRLGIILGSGLSSFAKNVKIQTQIPFADIPHFAVSSVEGHPGKLLLGELEGIPVAVMQGRLHAYEGLTFQQVVYPVRTLKSLGIDTLMVTNAAGGLAKKMKPGDFMIIKDQINLTGDSPLRGHNWSEGPRFVDMTEPFDPELRRILKKSLAKQKVRHHEGVYVGVLGPAYETASEIKAFAKLGGLAVGMSTVAEVIAARHAGIKVVGLSCITNLGTGLSKTKLTHHEVNEVAKRVEDSFSRAIISFVQNAKRSL